MRNVQKVKNVRIVLAINPTEKSVRTKLKQLLFAFGNGLRMPRQLETELANSIFVGLILVIRRSCKLILKDCEVLLTIV